MSFSFQQSNSNVGAEPLAVPYDNNVGAGHLLVAACFWDVNTETCTVSDPNNGTWTAVGSPKTGTGALASFRGQLFYVLSSAAGATTVTANVSAAANANLAIHEYSSTDVVSVDGIPVYDNHVGDANPVSSAIDTTADADLLFAAVLTSTTTNAAGAGYLLRESATFNDNGTEDDTDGGAAGPKTASFSLSGSPTSTMGFIAFREGAVGPISDTQTRRYQIRRSRMTSW
jgi:hypothetical protein